MTDLPLPQLPESGHVVDLPSPKQLHSVKLSAQMSPLQVVTSSQDHPGHGAGVDGCVIDLPPPQLPAPREQMCDRPVLSKAITQCQIECSDVSLASYKHTMSSSSIKSTTRAQGWGGWMCDRPASIPAPREWMCDRPALPSAPPPPPPQQQQ